MDFQRYNTFLEHFSQKPFSMELTENLFTILDLFSNNIRVFTKQFESIVNAENSSIPTVKNILLLNALKEPIGTYNRLVIDSIFEICQTNDYFLAHEFLVAILADDGLIKPHIWIQSDLIILFVFLNMSLREISLDIPPILSGLSTIKEVKNCYYQLKFLIRRVQFSLPIPLQQELPIYLKDKNISLAAVQLLLTLHMNIENETSFFTQYDKISKIPFRRLGKGRHTVSCSSDAKKIFSFIICVNKDMYYHEISHYIKNLTIPEGYSLEILPIYHASSMCEGYNVGMKQAKGRYKIYIHQDVFIINKNMLFELLDIFHMDDTIGMVGVAGNKQLCSTGIFWSEDANNKNWRADLYQDQILGCQDTSSATPIETLESINMIDGVFMATSKDIPWREDLFHGFHHYDISQAQEFIRAGYQVVIPKQKELWCLHDQNFTKIPDISYEESRKAFIKEYIN